MQNTKIPIALFILGLGVLSYQFIMHPTAKEQAFTKHFLVGRGDLAEDVSNSNDEVKPHKLPKLTHPEVAGLAPATKTPSEIPVVTAPAPIPVPVDMAALAKATDEKAKPADKKKKKKKKTVSPNPDSNAQNQNQIQAPAPTSDLNANQDVPPAPVPAPAQANTANPGGALANTPAANTNALVKYYENILLKEPSTSETQKFVSAHKAKQITDDVYFTVAAAMMADSRLQMKDLAVFVYSQDLHIKSFVALVNILDTDANNDIVKTDSLKYLNMYSDVTIQGSVNVLAQALAMPITTRSLHIEALKLLDTAAKQYAQLEMSQPLPAPGQVSTFAYSPANAQKLFIPFINLLTALVHNSTDGTTKSIASQDLGDLQGLFGSQSASINP